MQKIEENDHINEARPIQWHMIGHLQKNKVKYLIGQVALIHSVDTVSLAEQIEKEAAKAPQNSSQKPKNSGKKKKSAAGQNKKSSSDYQGKKKK